MLGFLLVEEAHIYIYICFRNMLGFLLVEEVHIYICVCVIETC